MTIEEIDTLLKTTGFPVKYDHFTGVISPPCITYLTPYTNNVKADNKAYVVVNHWQVELYTNKKI